MAILFRATPPIARYPVLPFLVFLEKGRENPPKKQGFFIPTEPLKSLEKKGKTLKKNKEFLARRKNKEFQKNKERKDRVGFRGKLFLRYSPCLVCLGLRQAIFTERSGGVAAIVCDTCLAIGGGISVGSLGLSSGTLIFFSLLFWISLSKEFLAFWRVFLFLPKDFGVRRREKILALLVVFLAVFQKNKEKEIREQHS